MFRIRTTIRVGVVRAELWLSAKLEAKLLTVTNTVVQWQAHFITSATFGMLLFSLPFAYLFVG